MQKLRVAKASVRWLQWDFEIFQLDDELEEVGGVYLFCGIRRIKDKQDRTIHELDPLYVGETENFKTRPLGEGHEKWKAAVLRGVQRFHLLTVEKEAIRKRIELKLIEALRPPLNIQNKPL